MTWAMVLFPGGNRFDNHFPRFSFYGNFLCDLFHGITYCGLANPGREHALWGTRALGIALLSFWLLLPRLFRPGAWQRKWVGGLGVSATVIAFGIASDAWHDTALRVSVLLVLIVFVGAIRALSQNGELSLARLGIASLALCFVNYLSLITDLLPRILPGLQKITLLGFLAWVTACMAIESTRTRGLSKRDRPE